MIVLEKDGLRKPVDTFKEAQALVGKGWSVFINKTGKKITPLKKVKKTIFKKTE